MPNKKEMTHEEKLEQGLRVLRDLERSGLMDFSGKKKPKPPKKPIILMPKKPKSTKKPTKERGKGKWYDPRSPFGKRFKGIEGMP